MRSIYTTKYSCLEREEALAILENFDKSKHAYTNKIDDPIGGEVYIFYSENHDEKGKT